MHSYKSCNEFINNRKDNIKILPSFVAVINTHLALRKSKYITKGQLLLKSFWFPVDVSFHAMAYTDNIFWNVKCIHFYNLRYFFAIPINYFHIVEKHKNSPL